MANYYSLGASVPDLLLDDVKVEYSTQAFIAELKEKASKADRHLIDLVLLRGDNRVLLALLRGAEELPTPHLPLATSEEELQRVVDAVRSELNDDPFGRIKVPANIPSYLTTFARDYVNDRFSGEDLFIEDLLATRYHDYVMRKANKFLSAWMDLNLNISNILATVTAKKFGLDTSKYIIGNNLITALLREGGLAELSSTDSNEMLQAILKIGEETEPMNRERKIDALKWNFLTELTFADSFSIDAMLAYLLKLQIIERWLLLDKQQGKERFREIIMGLKKEGREELADFVARTKK